MDDLKVKRIDAYVVESDDYDYKRIFVSVETAAHVVASVMFYSQYHPPHRNSDDYRIKVTARLARFVLAYLKEQLEATQ